MPTLWRKHAYFRGNTTRSGVSSSLTWRVNALVCSVTSKFRRLAKNAMRQLPPMIIWNPDRVVARVCISTRLFGSRMRVVGISHTAANGDMYRSRLKLFNPSAGLDRRRP